MKIGLTTRGFSKPRETEDVFALLKELGAETCEVYLRTFYEYRPEFAKKYAERLSGLRVDSVRVAPCNFEYQLLSQSRRVRGDGFYWLDQVMRSAQLLGAEYYAFRGGNFNGNYDETGWSLGEVAEFCSRYGIGFCLENSKDGIFSCPKTFRELKSRNDNLACSLDLGSAVASGYPWQTYVAAAEGSAFRVTVPAVWGTCRLNEVFKRLKDIGFDGAVLLDICGSDNPDEVKRIIDTVKNMII